MPAKITEPNLPTPDFEASDANLFTRIWFTTPDGVSSWDVDKVTEINWLDDRVVVFYEREDMEVAREQTRYLHVNKENLVGIKHIRTPAEVMGDE